MKVDISGRGPRGFEPVAVLITCTTAAELQALYDLANNGTAASLAVHANQDAAPSLPINQLLTRLWEALNERFGTIGTDARIA
jgi:hypothetical protein